MTTAAPSRVVDLFGAAAPSSMPRNWIAVASAEHVALGRSQGFMQVCHGKGAPLRRLRPGDRMAYYSPTVRMGRGPALQAFTAIGCVGDDPPHQHDMGGGFVPWRRAVAYVDSTHAAIRPLLDQLSFTRGQAAWGARFRYGLFQVPDEDIQRIALAMQAPLALLGWRSEAQAA
jgi:hypothetical protein